MKSLLLPLLLSLFVVLLLSGCFAITKAQLENKLPRIDAHEVSVEVSTIYGVSGTLRESGVKWNGDTKHLESSELRITSPLGSYKRTITAADVGKAPSTPPLQPSYSESIKSLVIPTVPPLTADNLVSR